MCAIFKVKTFWAQITPHKWRPNMPKTTKKTEYFHTKISANPAHSLYPAPFPFPSIFKLSYANRNKWSGSAVRAFENVLNTHNSIRMIENVALERLIKSWSRNTTPEIRTHSSLFLELLFEPIPGRGTHLLELQRRPATAYAIFGHFGRDKATQKKESKKEGQ